MSNGARASGLPTDHRAQVVSFTEDEAQRVLEQAEDEAASLRDLVRLVVLDLEQDATPTVARVILSHIRRAEPPLDRERFQALMELLRVEGDAEQRLLRLAPHGEMWDYLREQGISWDKVLANYEVTVGDHIDFYAGFLSGAGVTIVSIPIDIVEALYVLTGSIWDEKLANKRDEFFAALVRLIKHPLVTGKLVGGAWLEEYERHIVNLRFFQAGALVGQIAPDLVGLVAGLPKAAARAARLLASLPRLGTAALKKLVKLKELAVHLRTRLTEPKKLSSGHVLEPVGDAVLVRAPDGSELGLIEPGDLTSEELAAWEKGWSETLAALPDPGDIRALPHQPLFVLEADRVTDMLLAQVPQGGRTVQAWGTALHEVLKNFLRTFPGGERILIFADVEFRKIVKLPPNIDQMTVGDFLQLHPDIGELGAVRGDVKFLGQTVGTMRPDLIAFDPLSGQALVWDLAPKFAGSHFKKTLFYEKVLSHTADVRYVTVAETFYRAAGAAATAVGGP